VPESSSAVPVTKVALVRHGEAHVNLAVDGPMVADTEGLTERGRQQAQALADRLARSVALQPDAAVSSSYPRAAQTAAVVTAALGLAVELDDELQEWRLGEDSDGTTFDDVEAAWARLERGEGLFDRISPGVESYAEFSLRVGRALEATVARHRGTTVLVFAHGGVIDLAMNGWTRSSWLEPPRATYRTRHTSITEWWAHHHEHATTWELRRYNDDHHVAESELNR
jgi:probable phosphoglycerate mutase